MALGLRVRHMLAAQFARLQARSKCGGVLWKRLTMPSCLALPL